MAPPSPPSPSPSPSSTQPLPRPWPLSLPSLDPARQPLTLLTSLVCASSGLRAFPPSLPCRYVPDSLTSYPDRLIRYKTYLDCNNLFEAAAPEGAPDEAGGDPFLDNAAPQGLRPSFRILATMYLAMALLALLYRI